MLGEARRDLLPHTKRNVRRDSGAVVGSERHADEAQRETVRR